MLWLEDEKEYHIQFDLQISISVAFSKSFAWSVLKSREANWGWFAAEFDFSEILGSRKLAEFLAFRCICRHCKKLLFNIKLSIFSFCDMFKLTAPINIETLAHTHSDYVIWIHNFPYKHERHACQEICRNFELKTIGSNLIACSSYISFS